MKQVSSQVTIAVGKTLAKVNGLRREEMLRETFDVLEVKSEQLRN